MKTYSGLKAIQSLDLEAVEQDLRSKSRWDRARVESACREYKLFLERHLTEPENDLPPLYDVDEVWHYHILRTHQYAADCEAIFGHFLHHVPSMPLEALPPSARGPLPQSFFAKLFGFAPQFATCGSGGSQGT